MRVIAQKHMLSRSRINSKWAGRDRFLPPWTWKRAFMQLKAERGQNKLAASLIWNGADPLRLVVQGELLQEVWLELHLAVNVLFSIHRSYHSWNWTSLSSLFTAICLHYLKKNKTKTKNKKWKISSRCCFSSFDWKCFYRQVFSEWQAHSENRASVSAMRKMSLRGNNGSGLTANRA